MTMEGKCLIKSHKKPSSSGFLTEPTPGRGRFEPVAAGVSRAVANNPSIMTYHGTNSYLIETSQGDFLLDPGPAEDEAHLDLLCRALAPKGAGILLTHFHADHAGLAGLLKERTGLPIYASERFAGRTLVPDIKLQDGDDVAGLTVVFTPGHASDHICLSRGDVLFSGDQVMSWNSSVVWGPDGNMSDYISSLIRLLGCKDPLFLPGHGPPLPDPHPYMERLLSNRVQRESGIRDLLKHGPMKVAEIARRLYAKEDNRLALAAEANVSAHLHKLEAEGAAVQIGSLWHDVPSQENG